MTYRILVADAEPARSASIFERLAREGYDVSIVGGTAAPEGAVPSPDLLVLHAGLYHQDGHALLERLHRSSPELETIFLKDTDADLPPPTSKVVDVLPKNADLDGLVRTVRRLSDRWELRRETRQQYGFQSLIGESTVMRTALDIARRVALTEASAILIRGESGTGKDLLARAIHFESPRAERPFVTVMCTALQDTLLENDLFGHEKGAYTDAKGMKKGLFEVADGGSLFLNEIGDMGLSLQSKLLRVLDEQTFRRVGGSEDIRVNVRIIAATNRDLEALIAAGKFRSDLFYRLNIFPLYLSPLRERSEDLPLFVQHFLRKFGRKYRKNLAGLSPEALSKLQGYDWPGNVRELRNVMERACALSASDTLSAQDLVFWRLGAVPERQRPLSLPPGGVKLDEVERDLVVQAMERAEGNQTMAAALLGISRFRLRGRLKRFRIQVRPDRPSRPRP